MIPLITWLTPAHHGVINIHASRCWHAPSPDLASSQVVTQLVGKPVKYFQRMTPEARWVLAASAMALREGALPPDVLQDVGMLAGRFEGCQQADQRYYEDYLASQRTLARGNLFVYTLPTSVCGAVSVVLGLAGPSLYVRQDQQPLAHLLTTAQRMVHAQEAQAMLAIWSDEQAAVCFLVQQAIRESIDLAGMFQVMGDDPSPTSLADHLARQVSREA